ncbi:protein NCA1 [Tanacetum coccineum]
MTPVGPFVKAARPDDGSSKKSSELQNKQQGCPVSKEIQNKQQGCPMSKEIQNKQQGCPMSKEAQNKQQGCPMSKVKQDTEESNVVSPKCPFGYDSQTFKLGPFSCLICQALLFESSRCVPCTHVFCKACISRFNDCPLCGADIEKIEADTNLQSVVDRFIDGHARIKRGPVNTDEKQEVSEKKTVIYEDVSLERGAFLVSESDANRAMGDASSAVSYFDESVTFLSKVQTDDLEVTHTLSVSLNKIGDLKYYEGDLQAARDHYFRALDVRRNAIKDSSKAPSQVLDLAVSLAKVADVDRNLDAEDTAIEGFQEAITLLKSLKINSEENALEQRISSTINSPRSNLTEIPVRIMSDLPYLLRTTGLPALETVVVYVLENDACFTVTSHVNKPILSTDVVGMALPVQNINHSAFKSMFEKEKLSGNNFNEWFARLNLLLVAEPNVVDQWTALYDAHTEIACLIHRQFELYYPFNMIQELRSMFEKQAGVEKFDLIQSFHTCKQEEGKPVADYVLKMKGYLEKLERLGYVLPQDISVGLILNGLTKDFVGFVRNYNMHNMGKTIGEIHAMLIEYEKGLPKKAETSQVMMIKSGKIQKANKKSLNAKGKNKVKGKGKDKKDYIPKPKNPKPTAMERPAKDDACHHCKEVGHWKRNCPVYLAELQKKRKQVGSASSSGIFTIELFSFPNNNSWVYDTGCGTNICITKQGFRIERKLKQGALYLYVGNGVRAQVEAIGSFDLVLPNGLVICLDNCHYAPTITRGVVLVSRLVDNGFVQCFTDYGISVSKNGVLYFNVVLMLLLVMVFKNEVKNQLGKTIKAIRSDRGGEYISQEFKDYLKSNGIVQHLTPPYTPQHNRVSV